MPVSPSYLLSVSKPLVSLLKTGSTWLTTLCSHKSLILGFSMGAGLWFGLSQSVLPLLPPKAVTPFYSSMTLKTYLHISPKTTSGPIHLKPGAPRLSPNQIQVLRTAYRIGHQLGMGDRLAAVAFQESGLGLDPVSPAHYGAGSVGYLALQQVLQAHPRLQPDFQGRNWAQVLIQNPKLSLLVAGYYLQHCYHVAGNNWQGALNLYRYGYGQQGTYPAKISHWEQQLQPYFEQI